MTFNGSWGYQPAPPEDWRSVREVIGMLRTCAAGGGNLLLNIGPTADGSVPELAAERLTAVGKWLNRFGEPVYGKVARCDGDVDWLPTGTWTAKDNGKTAYFWCARWPGEELAIGGLKPQVLKASLLHNGRRLRVKQTADRLVLRGLPRQCPDKIAGVAIIKLELKSKLRQQLGAGCVLL